MTSYAEPVNRLLNLGQDMLGKPWLDYCRYGLLSEHVPELIRMMTDLELNQADTESKEVWAPMHAWRALAQLQAPEAIDPFLKLLILLNGDEPDDWILDDAPAFFAAFGTTALPRLVGAFNNADLKIFTRWRLAEVMTDLVKLMPETAPEVIAALAKAAVNDPKLNAGIIASLVDLHAVDSAPLIERAYETGKVDEQIVGRLEDVQFELGLLDEGALYDWEEDEEEDDDQDWDDDNNVAPAMPNGGLHDVTTGGLTPRDKAEMRRKKAKAAKKRERKRRQ